MPTKPKVPCKHPGCAALIPSGTKYCDLHRPLHPEEVRSATSRGYDRAWQKASRLFLQAHPLCEECMKRGKYTKAGIGATGVPFASAAMTRRQGVKIKRLCTTTEGGHPGGGVKSLRALPQGPPPPLALKSAKL